MKRKVDATIQNLSTLCWRCGVEIHPDDIRQFDLREIAALDDAAGYHETECPLQTDHEALADMLSLMAMGAVAS